MFIPIAQKITGGAKSIPILWCHRAWRAQVRVLVRAVKRHGQSRLSPNPGADSHWQFPMGAPRILAVPELSVGAPHSARDGSAACQCLIHRGGRISVSPPRESQSGNLKSKLPSYFIFSKIPWFTETSRL